MSGKWERRWSALSGCGEGLPPTGSGLFLGAEQDKGGHPLALAGRQELRELGKRGHGSHVVEDERHWWVEPTVG